MTGRVSSPGQAEPKNMEENVFWQNKETHFDEGVVEVMILLWIQELGKG